MILFKNWFVAISLVAFTCMVWCKVANSDPPTPSGQQLNKRDCVGGTNITENCPEMENVSCTLDDDSYCNVVPNEEDPGVPLPGCFDIHGNKVEKFYDVFGGSVTGKPDVGPDVEGKRPVEIGRVMCYEWSYCRCVTNPQGGHLICVKDIITNPRYLIQWNVGEVGCRGLVP